MFFLNMGGFHCQASQRVKAIHFQPGAIGSGHLRIFFYFVASLGGGLGPGEL